MRIVKLRRRYEKNGGFDSERLERDLYTAPYLHHFTDNWALPRPLVSRRLSSEQPVDMSDALRCLYSLYAETRSKPRYGDKTPVFVLEMRKLASIFPEARFIHLIRDGRDVTVSIQEIAARDLPRGTAEIAGMWAGRIEEGRRAGTGLGPGRYLEIHYEELVDDATAVLKEVCEFVELDFDRRMLTFHEDGMERLPPNERWLHPGVSRPPERGMRDWRREMRPRRVAMFEAIAGSQLRSTGYVLSDRSSNWIRVAMAPRRWRRKAGAVLLPSLRALSSPFPTIAMWHWSRRAARHLPPESMDG